MDEQIEQLEAYIADKIDEGFETRDSIIEQAVDFALDGSAAELQPLIERLTDAAILRRRAEQAAWTEPTDCDKLDSAFAALEEQGIVARQNFACCNTCAFAEMKGELKTPRCGRPPVGFAFYHSQDTESAREDGTIWIKFAACDPDTDYEWVGEAVLDALLAAGLDASWDGDPDTAVEVSGIVWQKRTAITPPLTAE